MYDYGNIPSLNWREAHSADRASVQILRQEPVILNMPDGFGYELDAEAMGCDFDPESGILFNCDGRKTVEQLAQSNDAAGLKPIAEACHRSGSRVDVDAQGHRLIIHD